MKPSIAPKKDLKRLVIDLKGEVYNLGDSPSVLRVLESRLLDIIINICNIVDDTEFTNIDDNDLRTLLKLRHIKNEYHKCVNSLEHKLTKIYQKSQEVANKVKLEKELPFPLDAESRYSTEQLRKLDAYQQGMCSDYEGIDPNDLNICISELVEYSYSFYYMYHHFLFSMLVRIEGCFYYYKEESELQKMLVDKFREYSIANLNANEEYLREEAAKLKEHRSHKLSQYEWEKLYDRHDRFIECVKNEIELPEDIAKYYSTYDYEYYSQNITVLDLIEKGRRCEHLYSFDKLFQGNWGVFDKLGMYEDMLDVFFEQILINNIVMFKMFPELKEEFDKFLNHNKCNIPECLNTPEAQRIWKIVKDEGWVDENLQPVGLSRAKSALLAIRIGEVLNLQSKYAPFEALWKRSNMSSDHETAMGQAQASEWIDKFRVKIR